MAGSARGGVAVFSPSTRHPQHGNIETCLMLNKKGSRQCRRFEGAKQGDVDGPLECSLAFGMVAAETRRRVAAQQVAGSLPWIGLGRSIRRTATVSRPRNQSAGSSQTSSLEAYWCRRPAACFCRQTEAWLTCGAWMTATSRVTRSWCRLSCRNLTSPTAQSRSGVELPENISHLLRERPWMQRLLSGGSAKCSTWPKSPQSPLEARSESLSDLDSTSRTNSFLGKADVIRSDASTLPAPPGPADGIRPPPKVSPLSSLAAPILQEQRAAEIYDEVGQRSLERALPRSHGGLCDASDTQRGPVRNRVKKKERETSLLLHVWEVLQPPSRASIGAGLYQSTSWRPAFSRSSKQPPPPYLSALDDEDQAKLYVQKAAQAADEAWQQTSGGLQGPNVVYPTPPAAPLEMKAGLLSALEEPAQCAAAPSAAFTAD